MTSVKPSDQNHEPLGTGFIQILSLPEAALLAGRKTIRALNGRSQTANLLYN
ncbi:hypothetical protein SynROS8604_03176 [Synechococcus sp. ROS8604]|nr:hypothetical protein SynROS8604_03176 [Synechococcus sp. ROS8604]